METLHPLSHVPISDHRLVVQEMMSSSSVWTKEENKMFERALAMYPEDSPDRWFNIASMIPGKTVFDVMKQYSKLEEDVSDIEAGRVPVPGYPSATSPLWLDQDTCRRRPSWGRGSDHDRKKGVPWTKEEHRRFLLGLLKYGKGDWRNISRNFVVSKTPTQVASHAQKYYLRQLSGAKDKRRPSIHDTTTVNLLNANRNRSFSDHRDILPDLWFIEKDDAEEGLMSMSPNLSSANLFSPLSSPFYDAVRFAGANAFSARS
ncbi:Duplicated homeodomain-like superfamily protein [Raphanus sativus]|uniref:Transcription factor DIVARICATA-like n=1 Tax=Raphanus sativus TaxID=3726 RepID=A0A9W3BYI4_RAPSA|nr:transcription factor DIVARICATA-like [Raphanus sativus]XP_056844301.1 transcription factor DIVARICATA-like [Raphanus sativus]KAJ4885808.1 Duplicated homeodomain-like superfamily protein [Raphanus sativus]